jgi:pyrroline-5-carboxylate reductase
MGAAIAAALVRGKLVAGGELVVADPVASRAAALEKEHGARVAASNAEAVRGADYVLFAVKPQDFPRAGASVADALAPEATVISIMAGVPIATLVATMKHAACVRAMPNTPAQVGEGMTVWTASPQVSEAGRAQVAAIFRCMGREAYVADESYIDMATALNGSGPGFVFLFIEALIDGGVRLGLPRDLATEMALQTVGGSARYAQQAGEHLAVLRAQVTSPGGTTAAGLQALEAAAFRAAVAGALQAAYERSRALGQG